MKIAHIVCSYPPYYGGMGNVAFKMVEELGKRGHDVRVFTPGYYEKKEIKPAEESVEPDHTEVLQEQIDNVSRLTPSIQYGNAAALPTIKEELEDMDIVHLHYPFFGTARIIKQFKKERPDIPLIVSYHMDPRGDGLKGFIFKLYSTYYMPSILNVADGIIAASIDYAKHSGAAESINKQPEKWHNIPFGVDTERFKPMPKRVDLIKRYNLDPQKKTLVFVGGMDKAHYFKGVSYLLKALSLLKKDKVAVQCVFVGGGELIESYKQEAKNVGVQYITSFVGYVSDEELPDYYNLGDLFVLPSIHQGEAFGMVLLEAMACGIPVVASNLPGVRDVVSSMGGIVTPPKDAEALAASIKEALSSERLDPMHKAQLRDTIEKKYSWTHIVENIEQLYERFNR